MMTKMVSMSLQWEVPITDHQGTSGECWSDLWGQCLSLWDVDMPTNLCLSISVFSSDSTRKEWHWRLCHAACFPLSILPFQCYDLISRDSRVKFKFWWARMDQSHHDLDLYRDRKTHSGPCHPPFSPSHRMTRLLAAFTQEKKRDKKRGESAFAIAPGWLLKILFALFVEGCRLNQFVHQPRIWYHCWSWYRASVQGGSLL